MKGHSAVKSFRKLNNQPHPAFALTSLSLFFVFKIEKGIYRDHSEIQNIEDYDLIVEKENFMQNSEEIPGQKNKKK